MNISTLTSLLNDTPDVFDRSTNYQDQLENKLQPFFSSLIAEIESNSVDFNNNQSLNNIREVLDELFGTLDEDTAVVGNIITEIGDAAVTLEDTTEAQLTSVKATVISLYDQAQIFYDAAFTFNAEQKSFNDQRETFDTGPEGSPKHNFFIQFDEQLLRNGTVVKFLYDNFLDLTGNLNALKNRIEYLLATEPPPAPIEAITGLLGEIDTIITRSGEVILALQNEQSRLLNLGQGLIDREIELNNNSTLAQVKSTFDTLIASAPTDSATHDGLLGELSTALNTFVAGTEDPDLAALVTLSTSKNAEAKVLYEQAHLVRESFLEMETLQAKVGKMTPTAEELVFLSKLRLQTDRFDLLANYIEITLDKLVTITWQVQDTVAIDWNDPRNKIMQFNDNLPFALLPVRVETRFMTIKHVRDNLAYSSVNDVLRSDLQVAQAHEVKQASTLMFESSPKQGDTLQAVSAPEMVPDKHELWVRIYPDDIAIDTHESQLTQSEIDAGKIYWEEMWALGTTLPPAPASNPELGPWRVLCSVAGPRRAAWIAKQMEPSNISSRPLTSTPTPPVTAPSFPTPTPKSSSWSKQAHTKVMPDRFVVRVYSTSGPPREVVGSLVPSPLPVAFDPANSYGSYLNQSGSGLNMPADLRWLTEFEEAERVGMGIRVKLEGNEKNKGLERLLVLGFKQNLDADEGSELLEELFNNHHYATGIALVPQGTATNNTEEKKSGYGGLEPGHEESFATERQADLFSDSTSHYEKKDGQRLAEALGIDTLTFKHVANSNISDVKEAMAMSRALWSTTLGYYLKNLLTPSVANQDIANTRNFFTNFVLGRGLIPAFRIRNQPYGVLPATVHSRWKFSDERSYEGKLYSKVLEPLRQFWKSEFVPTLDFVKPPYPIPEPQPDDLMTRILGLHPASIEYYQRLSAGKFMWSNMVKFMVDIGISQQDADKLNFTGFDGQLDTLFKSDTTLDYSGIPRIFGMTFSKSYRTLNGPIIDKFALSEKNPIQKIPNSSEAINANYIHWIQQSALSKIRNEDFTNIGAPANQAPPQALLYLLLRHAWFLEHLEASHCLLSTAQLISVDAWFNQEFIKITGDGTGIDDVTEEQKELLYGVVKSEVRYEYGIVIDNTMRNLDSNTEYQSLGMTPQAYEVYIRDRAIPYIESDAEQRYNDRLAVYSTEGAQWKYLTDKYPSISEGMTMEDYLHQQIFSSNPCIGQLREVSDALEVLKNLPTARLERCLAEHLDTCAFRLDSWLNAKVLQRMKEQREAAATGIYVGAYGILEKPHPGPFPGIHVVNLSDSADRSSWSRAMTRVGKKTIISTSPVDGPLIINPDNYVTSISSENQPATFIYLGDDTETRLIEDRDSGEIVPEERENIANQGFILAPSLNHAVAAAILRAGYIAHKNTGSPNEAMSVTLTSARVRTAMYYLDGVRNGQMLAALLGYRFERGLHEWQSTSTTTIPLDIYIYELRKKYPLVASTLVNNGNAQTNHVVDGLQLLQAFNNVTPYFWASGIIGLQSGTGHNAIHYNAIKDIIEKVKGDLDAIGDLLLSESIYQVSRGNQVRAGSILNALGAGETIPEPEIIKTPRQSDTITHRCMVQLEPADVANIGWIGNSFRADMEPALNNWLATKFPDPTDILIHVNYSSRSAAPAPFTYTLTSGNITLNDLDLQPIDLLSIFSTPGIDIQNDSSDLSRRVINHVQKNVANHDDRPVTVEYKTRDISMVASQRTIFELMPLINSLIQIVGKSRPVEASDFMVPGLTESLTATYPGGGTLDSTGIISRLNSAIGDLFSIKNELDVNYSGSPAKNAEALTYTDNIPDIPNNAITYLGNLRDSLMNAANFGIEGAIPETALSIDGDVKEILVAQAKRIYEDVNRRYTEANSRISATLPSDAKEKFEELLAISQILFNRSFRIFPDITLYTANSNDLPTALGYADLMDEAGDYAIEEWMYGVSRVRPRMGEYHKQMLLSETISNSAFTTQRVIQFPLVDTANSYDRWAAMKLPSGYEIPTDVLSIVLETNETYPGMITCGMVIDEWPEQIPLDNVTTGIAMHYDQPSSEAPQSILLATTPEFKSYWDWEDLMDTLNETVDMAMIRAVEPDQIEKSILAQVLPALVTQMNGGTQTSPSLDYAKNMIISPVAMDVPIDISAFVRNPLNLNNLNPNSSS